MESFTEKLQDYIQQRIGDNKPVEGKQSSATKKKGEKKK